MKRGLFITFEGGEGAGKTTQIKRLAASLGNCITTREPGGTPEAEALREVFIEQQGQNWPPQALLMLMFSARVLHTDKLIKPSLAQGKIVVCDRYTDSSFVYQGYCGGMNLQDIESVKKAALGHFEPDLTFILDIEPHIGLKRISTRENEKNTFESKENNFHYDIRAGFEKIAELNSHRCVIIDADRDEDVIATEILEKVRERLI